MSRLTAGVVGGLAGVAGGWITAVVLKLVRDGPTLLVNSDTVGAAIGAALTIGGTLAVTEWTRKRDGREEHRRRTSMLVTTLDLLEAELSRGPRFRAEFVTLSGPDGEKVLIEHIARIGRASEMAREARQELRGSAIELLTVLQDVQLAFAKATGSAERKLPSRTGVSSLHLTGMPLAVAGQTAVENAIEAVARGRIRAKEL